MPTVLITGSSGLVGSACVRHFDALGWKVYGLDNNQRLAFFGADGDTDDNAARLARECRNFTGFDVDIRAGKWLAGVVRNLHPDLVIHAAAQPSHDYAAAHPFEDFEVNAFGTLNLLEAVRQHVPYAVFVFLSTNKVYGDAPNLAELEELPTRWDFKSFHWPGAGSFLAEGIDEICPVDQSTHSLFGCSKLAADLYVQEYGRYFGLRTCCLRCGCLTGSAHAGTEQHGFLAYLARCVREGRPYTIYGYKGKQVRDQLHAHDVARACEEFCNAPRAGEVYNLGGGRANSISVLEAIDAFQQATGKVLDYQYVDEPRKGDHVVWISDCRKFRSHFPGWQVTRSLGDIVAELSLTKPVQSVSVE
jgi:CDP-paratose 2-epimerase